MSPEQQTTIPKKSPYAYFEFATVIKQQNKVHHVKLGIFPPQIHIKFIKIRATVI